MEQSELRRKCVEEIYTSEKSYVESLNTLVQNYLIPVRDIGLLESDQIHDIFSDVEIISNLSAEILNQLSERFHNWNDEETLIGDIFVRMGPMLRMYREYCKNFNTSLEALKSCASNEKWSDYLRFLNQKLMQKEGAEQQTTQYTLSSLLIMPVQRVPRYVLLLTELKKLTPETHPDYENITKAVKLIREIAGSLNEFIKDAESRNSVLIVSNQLVGLKQSLLEPHRRLIKQGILKKITSRMIQTCYLFLFNDILVYSHRQILTSYQYNGTIELGPSWVRDLEDTDKVKHVFQLVGTKKTWTFYADTLAQKTEWVRALDACIQELITMNPELMKKRSKVAVRQESIISWAFSPQDYDKELRKKKTPQKKKNSNLINEEGEEESESTPLLKGDKRDDEEKKGCCCCTIV